MYMYMCIHTSILSIGYCELFPWD